MVVAYHAATHLHPHIAIDCLAGHGTGAIAVGDASAIVSDDTAARVDIVHILECSLVIGVGNRAAASMVSDDTAKAIIAIDPSGIVAIVNLRTGRSIARDTADMARRGIADGIVRMCAIADRTILGRADDTTQIRAG